MGNHQIISPALGGAEGQCETFAKTQPSSFICLWTKGHSSFFEQPAALACFSTSGLFHHNVLISLRRAWHTMRVDPGLILTGPRAKHCMPPASPRLRWREFKVVSHRLRCLPRRQSLRPQVGTFAYPSPWTGPGLDARALNICCFQTTVMVLSNLYFVLFCWILTINDHLIWRYLSIWDVLGWKVQPNEVMLWYKYLKFSSFKQILYNNENINEWG